MPKMIDLGRKSNNGPIDVREEKEHIFYPSVYISDLKGDVPVDADMMNKDLNVKAVVRITGLNKNTNEDGERTSIDLEVRKIEFEGDSETNDLQDAIAEGLDKK